MYSQYNFFIIFFSCSATCLIDFIKFTFIFNLYYYSYTKKETKELLIRITLKIIKFLF